LPEPLQQNLAIDEGQEEKREEKEEEEKVGEEGKVAWMSPPWASPLDSVSTTRARYPFMM
jgi:hypothetical protein